MNKSSEAYYTKSKLTTKQKSLQCKPTFFFFFVIYQYQYVLILLFPITITNQVKNNWNQNFSVKKEFIDSTFPMQTKLKSMVQR